MSLLILGKIQTGDSVFIDTSPFIYFVERNPVYMDRLRPMFRAIERGDVHAMTSVVAYAEALVGPKRRHQWNLVSRYKSLMAEEPNLKLLPVDSKLAELAADIRVQHNLELPDAILWATAVQKRAKFFVTNDRHFRHFNNPRVIVLDEV